MVAKALVHGYLKNIEIRAMYKLRKAHIGALVASFVLLSFWFGTEATARNYTTNVPATENPVWESGNWLNGQADGLDWTNVRTTPGLAFGTEVAAADFGSSLLDDSTALLTGAWGPDQTVTATVYVNPTNQQAGLIYNEVEIRLRSSISGHFCDGYEVMFSMRNDNSCYVTIAKWNGALGSYGAWDGVTGSQYILHTGDVVKASAIGQTITAYINGVQVYQITDNVFTSGKPGIGFYKQGTSPATANSDYGFKNIVVSDEGDAPASPKLAISETNIDGTFTLKFSGGVPGTLWQIQYTQNLSSPSWQLLGSGRADATGVFQLTDTPPLGFSHGYYRAVSSGGASPSASVISPVSNGTSKTDQK